MSQVFKRQRGVTFFGMVVFIIVLALVGVLAAQVGPAEIEHRAVQAAVDKSKTGRSPDEVRQIFDRTADVEGIRSISGKDLEVTRNDAGKLVVAYAYDRQFRLVGPAYLLLKYNGKSN
ncbi:DUF4845 domain-containing protein [Ramlibacter sp. AW1]|uniref:DUF4845 domain-containing protein n=1 Tax=Ramlibacter aurantiacus TaxID=2801330 RepID=A0A936ZLL1_9BURK|nr:DUF4845 domain-containing protein [Ramlibacter aurantiacus]MBL0423132.1 DUF4845 domain-containing protein [Ramlibacter aurantiacus]